MKQPIDVTVVLLDGGWVSTSLGPIEVFHAAGLLWNGLRGEAPQPRFRVRPASIGGRPVTSVYGVGLTPQHAIEDITRTDLILVGAPSPALLETFAYDPTLIAWLRGHHARGTQIAGVCSGVACLAAAGLLDGRRATTHWAVADLLQQRFPAVLWQPDKFVTEDNGLYCGGGVYASIDLSLYLVDKLCGRDVALQAARALLVSMPRTSQAGYAIVTLARPHSDDRIRQAEEYLQRHFREPVSAEVIASRLGMSPRNLIRRFKDATGHVPGAYVQSLRIAAARELLERDALPIQTVAARIGYDDLAHFRSLFKRHTGMTPAEYRRRFGVLALSRGDLPASPLDAACAAP